MEDEQKSDLPPAPGILRAALGLVLLSSVVITPLPGQLSMGHPGFSRVPAPKKRTPAAAPGAGSTPDAEKRLTQAIQNLSPKDRKRLNKVMKRLSPEQRLQLIDAMKRSVTSPSHPTVMTPKR